MAETKQQTKQQIRLVFSAAQEGDLAKLNLALSTLLDNVGPTDRAALLRSARSQQRSVAVVAIQSLKTPSKTQMDSVVDTTTVEIYGHNAGNIERVDEILEGKVLDAHIQARLQIVEALMSAGADLNDETSIPTFNEAALDMINSVAMAQTIQVTASTNEVRGKLQRYSVLLLGLSRKAIADVRIQTTRVESARRAQEYKSLIARRADPGTGEYEKQPLVIAVRHGTTMNVNTTLRNFFRPESETFYFDINAPNANAPRQYVPKTRKERNRLSPLMRGILVEAVRFWAATPPNTPSRVRTEAILQAIVGDVRRQDAIGDPDLEGWNSDENSTMDQVWAECLAGLSSGNLAYTVDFAPGAAGTVLLNELTLANPANRFSGLRFSPSPPGPDSARRPLTAEQEAFCATIKRDFLNAASIPPAQHSNFIWCAVNETTKIFEESTYGTSRQGLRQRFSAYDSQQIARGSVCLCEYGPSEAEGKHEKSLNYTFGDVFSRQKYCRVVRAWDYVEFQRDDSTAGTIGAAGVLSTVAASSTAYFVPSLLASGSFWGSMLAGGTVTFLALQEYFRENNRIAVGRVESSKLAHRYDTSQPMARFGGRFQTDAGALDLSYVYDSYRKAGSGQSAERFSRMVQAFFAQRRLPQDARPGDPAVAQQAADAMEGTARNPPTGLLPGSLGAPRASRMNFSVGGRVLG